MGDELYLSQGEIIGLNNYDCKEPICAYMFGSIYYGPVECGDNNGTIDMQAPQAGFIHSIYFNQALAMEYEASFISGCCNALKIFDYTAISQETIREIGPVSNPNFMLIERFGIAAYWRKKGLGVQILKGIIRQMKGKCGYIVILDPKPVLPGDDMEDSYERYGVDLTGLERNPVTAQQKLNAFFRRCGFRTLKKYGNVFVCNVDQVTEMGKKIAIKVK